ncbi:hypothetical protein LOTGIDRAFT_164375 [Lottia gigantea]|uniref:PDZ domain-containing protein n=1 Tax=Lottia gigantea TaxID=225164 RepID=V4A094_LOTGI|nr:hypothetical protein LOTGIDRAFT_164375 [Lottia gigantea]ESO90072.1 hypothetical protein LOTGIDRAFT_164375 [Lottia gigantea]
MEMFVYVLSFCLLFGMCSAAECDVAVVVVASIFGTLAVVLLVIGIIGFLLWKKRKGLLSVKSNSTPNTKNKKGDAGLLNESGVSPTREGHVNPAFNNESGIISMEEGTGGFKDFTSPDHNKLFSLQSPSGKDINQKTWASLPGNDFSSPFNRQGSCGSLDDNYLNVDPEVTSVWLQSQDFIGLGFNISGNMRDGIFVSHVHNRGPAIESNKVKIGKYNLLTFDNLGILKIVDHSHIRPSRHADGDKILSVTISFENIVYEDALTILSYASPYPVKVTLQKEKVMVTDRRSSLTNEALSHPLYRSQSLDALQRVGKDSFKPKRTFSEMKSDSRKDSSLRKELSSNVSNNSEGFTSTPIKVTDKTVDGSNFQVSDILVHKAQDSGLVSDNKVSLDLSGIGMDKQDFDISGVKSKVDDVSVDVTGKAKDDLNRYKIDMSDKLDGVSRNASGQITDKLNNFGVPSDISSQVTSGVNSQISKVKVKGEQKLSDGVTAIRTPDERKSSNAREFASLMDEMLDMNQSSDEPFGSMEVKSISNGSLVVEDSFDASVSTENQMSPPTKPTRKKKRSSTASNSSEEISLSQSDIKIDFDKHTDKPSVVEDLMTITKVKDVSAAPPSGEMIEEDSIVAEKKKRDISILSDKIEFAAKEKESNQTELPSPTLLRKILLDGMDNVKVHKEPEPEGDPVEEEVIQAVKVSREDAAPPLPRTVRSEEDGKPGKRVGINNNLNDIDDELIDEIIAMNSRPIEPASLPGRNTKENFGGVSYDIQVADLDKIENKLRSEIEKDGPKSPTGGKAFEIREDLSGKLVNVDIMKSNISRTVSEAIIPPHSNNHESDDEINIKILRAGSLKEDKHHIKNDLDWSGKRLIRSGEFAEIPQDNSVKDFTDQSKISDGGETDNHKKVIIPISDDLKQELIKESLDLTNMSDISSSNSPSSTRSASPLTTTNGPPELSPLALKKALDFPSSESYSSSSRTGSYSFTLINKSGDEEDAEC